ncbi:MAG TPA: efflux RND transporter periplasmic adaptor subunit [Kofleriaceae bacterium]
MASAEPRTGRSLKLPIFLGAAVVGIAAIVAARKYERPAPKPEPPMPGVTTGSNSMTLTANAPAWNELKLGAPSPAQPHWTDAIPARVVFDETRATRLGSPLGGRVTSVVAERGQKVKAGAPLFSVSSPNLAELRADQAKAAIGRDTAKVNLDRVQALVDAGSIPAKELVAAKQELAEQNLAVSLAEQKMASLRVTGAGSAGFTVTAPRDGVVVEKNVAVGQLVDPSQGSLMAVADLSTVWVVADLFENDVGALAPGAKAKVVVNGTELDASVDNVSAVVDPDRHTVPVRLSLANADGALRPNSYAQIKFFDPTAAKVSLPASAVLSDGSQSYVYVKDPKSGALVRHDITVGSISGGAVPVLAGVEPSDQVVLKGAILLDNQIQLDN